MQPAGAMSKVGTEDKGMIATVTIASDRVITRAVMYLHDVITVLQRVEITQQDSEWPTGSRHPRQVGDISGLQRVAGWGAVPLVRDTGAKSSDLGFFSLNMGPTHSHIPFHGPQGAIPIPQPLFFLPPPFLCPN